MGRAVPGETSTIMKVFAVLLLAALAYAAPEAEPEADAAADAWYSYYGYGHPGYYGAYRGYYGLGWGGYYGGYYGYPRYGYRYYANSAGVVHAVAKREAEEPKKGPNPDADAEAWGYYRRYYGGYYGYPYGRYGYYWGK